MTWKVEATPYVGQYAQLLAISCISSKICTAVGENYPHEPPASEPTTLAERWDGRSWTRESTPNAETGLGGNGLAAISCPSRPLCIAVGTDGGGDGLAELRRAVRSKEFTVSHVATFADGTVRLRMTVPRPGSIDVLESARSDNFAGVAVLQPGAARFAFAREHVRASHPGFVTVTVTPNRRGRLLVAHHRHAIVLRLLVTYTPARGRPRSLRVLGIRLPVKCPDPDHDGDCDTI
jgi:hypothetical protein